MSNLQPGLPDDDADRVHEVLFSPGSLWPHHIWTFLDAPTKACLRLVSKAMRSQVDGLIQVVGSPGPGSFSAAGLTAALLQWPSIRQLTLINMSSVDLQPLTTTGLVGLTSLTVRTGQGDRPFQSWGVPMFSRRAAATLLTLDVSWCSGLDSITTLSDCVQLRCLRMRGCVGVADLSPLGACSQLEELWMAGNVHVTSLAPLKACPRLRKLDLSDCHPLLDGQVEDLQRACPHLAHPSSVVLEGLVHELQPTPPGGQALAVRTLRSRAFISVQQRTAIAAAGAIPPLVQLLGQRSLAAVHATAASALTILASNHAQNQTAITTAGAIPLLVQLLGQHSPITVQAAAKTLAELALSHAQNQAAVAAAGAIPPLVRLLGQHSSAGVQVAAAGTLRVLTYTHAGNQSDITAAGAIAPLIQLLGQHSSADVQVAAANALAALALSHAENQAAIAAAGAIPALVQLTGQHSSEDVQRASAMMCPPRAAAYILNILGFYAQQ